MFRSLIKFTVLLLMLYSGGCMKWLKLVKRAIEYPKIITEADDYTMTTVKNFFKTTKTPSEMCWQGLLATIMQHNLNKHLSKYDFNIIQDKAPNLKFSKFEFDIIAMSKLGLNIGVENKIQSKHYLTDPDVEDSVVKYVGDLDKFYKTNFLFFYNGGNLDIIYNTMKNPMLAKGYVADVHPVIKFLNNDEFTTEGPLPESSNHLSPAVWAEFINILLHIAELHTANAEKVLNDKPLGLSEKNPQFLESIKPRPNSAKIVSKTVEKEETEKKRAKSADSSVKKDPKSKKGTQFSFVAK